MNTNSNAAQVVPEVEQVEEGKPAETEVTLGHNNPPAITAFIPEMRTKAEAIGAFMVAATGFSRAAEVLDSKFNRLCLTAADIAFYLWISSNADVAKREKPTKESVVSFLKSVIVGDVTVVDVTDKETETVVKAIKYRSDKEKKAINEANKAQKAAYGDNFVPTAEFTPAAENTLNQYIPGAAAAAILMLFENDKPTADCKLDGTTYRRVYRWIAGQLGKGGHKAGDVIMAPDGNPLAIAEECPKGAYEGVAYNDHILHPFVQTSLTASDTERDSEGKPKMVPVYMARSKHAKYMAKPFVGATKEAALAHYERFFGKKVSGGVSFPKINDMTGVKVEETRTAGGTQSEGTPAKNEEETPAKLVPFDISTADKSAMILATLQAVRGLPNKEKNAGLNEDAVTALIDLYSLLGEKLAEWGYEADESDFEDTMSRVEAAA